MTEEIEVNVLKAFLNGADFVDNGDKISANELRVQELERNSLVERIVTKNQAVEKAVKPHLNKMAQSPKNKGKG